MVLYPVHTLVKILGGGSLCVPVLYVSSLGGGVLSLRNKDTGYFMVILTLQQSWHLTVSEMLAKSEEISNV